MTFATAKLPSHLISHSKLPSATIPKEPLKPNNRNVEAGEQSLSAESGLATIEIDSDRATILYLTAEQLTEMPQILALGNLDLPGVTKKGEEGRLGLEIFLSDRGIVDRVDVIHASVSPSFLSNALRVFQWGEYRPGKEFGRNMPSKLRVEVWVGSNSDIRVQ